ncbi:MAG: hypothetical protein L0Y72_13420 [Gemmataceae bacterium]|nr:hypothetical protein [Gemmataceae bacterium]
MSNTNRLSPDEARRIRRKRWVALPATIVVIVADVLSLISLGHNGPFVWIALCIPGVLLCIALDQWWMQCPRCDGSVRGTNNEVEWNLYPKDSGWVFVLPHRCRMCDVWLTPAADENTQESHSGVNDGRLTTYNATGRCSE